MKGEVKGGERRKVRNTHLQFAVALLAEPA